MKREEARRRGETYYYDGTMCINGHIDARYVSNRRCVICCGVDRSDGRITQQSILTRLFKDNPNKWIDASFLVKALRIQNMVNLNNTIQRIRNSGTHIECCTIHNGHTKHSSYRMPEGL